MTEPTTATRLRRVIDSTPRRSFAVPRGRALDDESVAALLGGSVYDSGVVVVDRVVPQSQRTAEPKNLAALVRRGTVVDESVGENLVYLDTETTGLAGGTGTVVFILGLARERASVVEVRQFILTGFVGEAALLAGAYDWLDDATGIVTYNGLSFDIPLLLTRFRMAELPTRHHQTLSGLPHLDLLHPVRAAFVRDWPNCTLQMAEQRLLHQHRVDDLPGSMVPAVFTDLVRYGRTSKLRPAVDHNCDDLVSLASLVDILGGVYAGNGSGDAGGVARRLVRHGDHDRAHSILTTRAHELSDRDQGLLATLERRALRIERRVAAQADREARQTRRATVRRRVTVGS
jgi:uncharacterized protein YprB with RNaseH-like and TPR domain